MATTTFEHVGTEIINRERVPVVKLPDGGEYIQQMDESGRVGYVSREGAKTFRKHKYPLHPSIEDEVQGSIYGNEFPFPLLEEEEQDRLADRVLRALFGRVLSGGVDFSFMGG